MRKIHLLFCLLIFSSVTLFAYEDPRKFPDIDPKYIEIDIPIIYIYDNGIIKNLSDKKYYQNKNIINILYEYNFTKKNPNKIKAIYFV